MSNTEFSHENLASRLARYLLDRAAALKDGRAAKTELESFLEYLNQSTNSNLLCRFVASVVSDQVSEAVQEEVRLQPVHFLEETVTFTFQTLNSKNLKSDQHKMELALKFFSGVLNNLAGRPESFLMNKSQLAQLESILRKANSYPSVTFPKMVEFTVSSKKEHCSTLANLVVLEGLSQKNSNQSHKEPHRVYLLSLEALLFRSNDISAYGSLTLAHLLQIIEWLTEPTNLSNKEDTLKSDPEIDFYNLGLFKQALSINLAKAVSTWQTSDLSNAQLGQIRIFMGKMGIRKGSPELSALERIALDFPSEPRNPEWWRSLTLSELVEICLDKPIFQEAIIDASKEGDWFNKVIEGHLASANDLKDLVTGITANSMFQKPSSEELTKLWKFAASKSQTLQDIEASLIEQPIENNQRLAGIELTSILSGHKAELEVLSEKLAKAKEDISKLQGALETNGNSVSEARSDIELGVAKKYGETLARMIRRLERDANKSTLKEILDREAAGLERLDIQLLLLGEASNFDPSIHDASGIQIALGNKVEVLETGAVLTAGDKKITLMKAIVKPSS